MGCDGGTIPKRDELVRTKKKPEQVDKDAETVAKWKHCAISQEALRMPGIVSCELGKLYNKDAVIEYLLDKSTTNGLVEHIRNLRDITEIQLTSNPSFNKSKIDKGDEYVDRQASEFICPVTGLEMNGKYRFCYIRSCACVMAERSLKEIKSTLCHKCGQPYEDDDVIIINGSAEDVEVLKARMEERRLKAKLSKKAKKDKKKAPESDEAPVAKKSKPDASNGATSSKTVPTTSKSTTKGLHIKSMVSKEEKLQQGYSVAKDPKASEAFKSLFTTHTSCEKQPRAHWITYNPLYN